MSIPFDTGKTQTVNLSNLTQNISTTGNVTGTSINGVGMSVGVGGIATQGSILTQGSLMFSDGSTQTTAATGITPAPSFSAHQTGNLSAVEGGSFEYNHVTDGNDDFDGEYYTVPKSGLYQFNWFNYGLPLSPNYLVDAQIMVTPTGGGAEYSIAYREGYKTNWGYSDGGLSFGYRLVAGDKVRVISPLGWSMRGAGDPVNWFNGFYISP